MIDLERLRYIQELTEGTIRIDDKAKVVWLALLRNDLPAIIAKLDAADKMAFVCMVLSYEPHQHQMANVGKKGCIACLCKEAYDAYRNVAEGDHPGIATKKVDAQMSEKEAGE